MLPARERSKPFLRGGAVGGLPEHAPVEEDVGIHPENDGVAGRSSGLKARDGLKAGVLEHEAFGIGALMKLLDVRLGCFELDSKPAEDLTAPGRAGGKDEARC